jgi:exodeoxyribonuclease VII large subunit
MVKYHPVYGLSLQISDIDPTYTLGEMAREKMETIEKLKKEGVFDLNRQVPVPLLPKRIAVISVKTSKGFSDFMSILQGNAWGYAFSCYLFPALLQGDKAVDSILGQLKAIKALAARFDAVAIIRGGGGDVGLNCYDHYSLAREVATFPIPVLSGIGHSTNETVVELVSGRNLITPTDVAYFLLQQFHNYSVRLREFSEKITKFAADLMAEEKHLLEALSRDLAASSKDNLHRERFRLHEMESRFRVKPMQALRTSEGRLNGLANLLSMQARQFIVRQSMRVGQAEQQVRLLDPLNVLKRGYSITYAKGKLLRHASEVSPGDEIVTKLHTGTIASEIKSTGE